MLPATDSLMYCDMGARTCLKLNTHQGRSQPFRHTTRAVSMQRLSGKLHSVIKMLPKPLVSASTAASPAQ